MKLKITRIIDANANRVREGLRVIEDIARFIKDDEKLTYKFKSLRHKITKFVKELSIEEEYLILSREIEKDVGKKNYFIEEKKRENILDILKINFKRSEEAIRVLEEISKLFNFDVALKFKKMRYELYSLEKQLLK